MRRSAALAGAVVLAAGLTYGAGTAAADDPPTLPDIEDCGDLTSTQVFLLRAQIAQNLVTVGGVAELTQLEAPYLCTHTVTDDDVDGAGGGAGDDTPGPSTSTEPDPQPEPEPDPGDTGSGSTPINGTPIDGTEDDDSTATTSGGQITDVPEGSVSTGGA